MADFIFFLHKDVTLDAPEENWEPYLAGLRETGRFSGGSSVGEGATFRKLGVAAPVNAGIGGYIKVTATDLADARTLLAGNPAYEAGGTVEIRELPRT